ncbi:hypothetical protein JOM56_008014 [Amanita muscaria]
MISNPATLPAISHPITHESHPPLPPLLLDLVVIHIQTQAAALSNVANSCGVGPTTSGTGAGVFSTTVTNGLLDHPKDEKKYLSCQCTLVWFENGQEIGRGGTLSPLPLPPRISPNTTEDRFVPPVVSTMLILSLLAVLLIPRRRLAILAPIRPSPPPSRQTPTRISHATFTAKGLLDWDPLHSSSDEDGVTFGRGLVQWVKWVKGQNEQRRTRPVPGRALLKAGKIQRGLLVQYASTLTTNVPTQSMHTGGENTLNLTSPSCLMRLTLAPLPHNTALYQNPPSNLRVPRGGTTSTPDSTTPNTTTPTTVSTDPHLQFRTYTLLRRLRTFKYDARIILPLHPPFPTTTRLTELAG